MKHTYLVKVFGGLAAALIGCAMAGERPAPPLVAESALNAAELPDSWGGPQQHEFLMAVAAVAAHTGSSLGNCFGPELVNAQKGAKHLTMEQAARLSYLAESYCVSIAYEEALTHMTRTAGFGYNTYLY